MEEPGRLQFMGSGRVGHDWATSLSLSLSRIGEGNGNPLQCSCLENPREVGAWWAAVYGVAQSRTRLKRLSSSSSSLCWDSEAQRGLKARSIILKTTTLSTLFWKSFFLKHWGLPFLSPISPFLYGGFTVLLGEGNGNPLQYSMENFMKRGTWRVVVHGVAKSRTWLKWLSTQQYVRKNMVEEKKGFLRWAEPS